MTLTLQSLADEIAKLKARPPCRCTACREEIKALERDELVGRAQDLLRLPAAERNAALRALTPGDLVKILEAIGQHDLLCVVADAPESEREQLLEVANATPHVRLRLRVELACRAGEIPQRVRVECMQNRIGSFVIFPFPPPPIDSEGKPTRRRSAKAIAIATAAESAELDRLRGLGLDVLEPSHKNPRPRIMIAELTYGVSAFWLRGALDAAIALSVPMRNLIESGSLVVHTMSALECREFEYRRLEHQMLQAADRKFNLKPHLEIQHGN